MWLISDRQNNGSKFDFNLEIPDNQSISLSAGTFQHGKKYDILLKTSFHGVTESSKVHYTLEVADKPEPGLCTVL